MIGDAPLIHEISAGAKELMVYETYGHALSSTPLTLLKVIMLLPNNEVDYMHSFTEAHHCNSLSVDDEQDLMIGCAWTTF